MELILGTLMSRYYQILLHYLTDKLGQTVELIASVLSCDIMRLSWQQHSYDPRGGSLRYQIKVLVAFKILLHNITVSNEQYDITKLSCGNSYTISVTSLLCEVE